MGTVHIAHIYPAAKKKKKKMSMGAVFLKMSPSVNLSNGSLACICDDKIDLNVLFYLHEEYGINRDAWQWLHLLILHFSVCFLHFSGALTTSTLSVWPMSL